MSVNFELLIFLFLFFFSRLLPSTPLPRANHTSSPLLLRQSKRCKYLDQFLARMLKFSLAKRYSKAVTQLGMSCANHGLLDKMFELRGRIMNPPIFSDPPSSSLSLSSSLYSLLHSSKNTVTF